MNHAPHLRKVNPLEVNKQISQLPDNVYGYIYGHTFERFSSGCNFLELPVERREISIGETRFFFEVRKYSFSDVRLIGFINDESHLSYSSKGLSENEMVVFPKQYQEYKNQVEIQLVSGVVNISWRNIQLEDVDVMTILDVNKIPSKYTTLDTEPFERKQKIPTSGSFLKQVVLHKNYSSAIAIIVILIATYAFHLVTGINFLDLLPW